MFCTQQKQRKYHEFYFSLDNQNRHDPSRTSLDVPEGDLECTAMYSEDITDADFDEINSGVTHTQEIPKVGYCTVYFILALFMYY